MTGAFKMCRTFALAAIFCSALCCKAHAADERGHLFIIGGGKRTPELMARFVELAGGKERARIVVLPMASAEPEAVGKEQVSELIALGVPHASYMILTREQALAPLTAARFDGATGIFFSGGDQSRLTAVLGGTPVLAKLLSLYAEGAVIGGTSAGAAVMSPLMITGDELLNKNTKDPFVFIKKSNIKLVEGFGFIGSTIIDQHFLKRKRHNRLISVVLEHPSLVGIGIDEATAIVVGPGDVFEVTGEGTVIVYDAAKARGIRTDKNGNLGAQDIRMHILMAGDRYSLTSRRGPQ